MARERLIIHGIIVVPANKPHLISANINVNELIDGISQIEQSKSFWEV